jgi:DNA replication protein DnaC
VTNSDPAEFRAAVRAEARDLARQDAIDNRLRILLDRRPPAFDKPGELHPDICQWADGYLAGHCGGLVLIGAVGTGKTWSLWKAAETLTHAGWTGRFEIAATYEIKEATDRPVNRAQIDTWRDADLFAIDDPGANGMNDWDADALAALIDRRWQHRRSTLVATNEANLRGLLGDRAASRLADGATVVRFTGEDRRRAR